MISGKYQLTATTSGVPRNALPTKASDQVDGIEKGDEPMASGASMATWHGQRCKGLLMGQSVAHTFTVKAGTSFGNSDMLF